MVILATTKKVFQVFPEGLVPVTLIQGRDLYGWTDYIYQDEEGNPLTPQRFIPPELEALKWEINNLVKPATQEELDSRLYSLMLNYRDYGLPSRQRIVIYSTVQLPLRGKIVAVDLDNNFYTDISFNANEVKVGDTTLGYLQPDGFRLASHWGRVTLIVETELNHPWAFWCEFLGVKLNLQLFDSSEIASAEGLWLGSMRMTLDMKSYIERLEAKAARLEQELG